MYSIYFMKIEAHGKLSFHSSDFWPPILPASTTYKKDGATRGALVAQAPDAAGAPAPQLEFALPYCCKIAAAVYY